MKEQKAVLDKYKFGKPEIDIIDRVKNEKESTRILMNQFNSQWYYLNYDIMMNWQEKRKRRPKTKS